MALPTPHQKGRTVMLGHTDAAIGWETDYPRPLYLKGQVRTT
jgi:hypothetical protein